MAEFRGGPVRLLMLSVRPIPSQDAASDPSSNESHAKPMVAARPWSGSGAYCRGSHLVVWDFMHDNRKPP